MKRFCASLAMAGLVAFGAGAWLTAPAAAAPPTVVPSPGYDARLQEQRAAQSYGPVVRAPRLAHRHHAKRHHDGAH